MSTASAWHSISIQWIVTLFSFLFLHGHNFSDFLLHSCGLLRPFYVHGFLDSQEYALSFQSHLWISHSPVFPFKFLGQLLISFSWYSHLRQLQYQTITANCFMINALGIGLFSHCELLGEAKTSIENGAFWELQDRSYSGNSKIKIKIKIVAILLGLGLFWELQTYSAPYGGC